jgi:methylmalonyl-CoA epimerase
MPDFTLDHLVIAVRDLDAATADYAALLGREPSWQGDHPAVGTRNTLFRIENTYVELLAPGDGKKANKAWGGELLRFLERGEGLYALALGTRDIDTAVQELRRADLEVLDPAEGNGVDARSGNMRAWRNAVIPSRETNGLRVFIIEHASPPDALPPARPSADDPACVDRLDHVVALSPDMEQSRKLWAQTLGVRLALDRTFPERNTRILFFRLGDVTVEISGGAVQAQEGVGKPDRLWGAAWGVRDAPAISERLREAGFDVSDPRPGIKPGTVVCTVRGDRTHGVATLIIEHTPESFLPESRLPQGEAYDNAPEQRAFATTGLHHVSLAVGDIEAAAATWERVLGLRAGEPALSRSAQVRLAKVPAGSAFVELAQPLSRDDGLGRWVAERGQGMYAVALEVDNVDFAVADLRSRGVTVSDAQYGGWPGTRVARIDPRSANGVNVVLVQRLPELL